MQSKLNRLLGLLCLLQATFFVLPATAAPLSGTKSIGPTGDYTSITAAIAGVKTQTLGGSLVLELQPTYLSTVETFPLVFSNLTTTAANTLTLRPQTGATNLLITSADTTAATVDLNGAQFLTIDGRPGGVGSNAGSGGGAASQLTIANTSTSGRAIRFINESSGNTFKYVTFRGVNTSATSGTLLFSTTIGANGNDNNTIDHCDIRDGASTPAKGIYALGTTSAPARNNSGNTVSNCNIFNFYASVDTAGVRLDGGNTDWTIAGNSFYQTAIRASVSTSVRAIYVDNTSGNNFTVTGNFIGGDSPVATVTTQKWTATGTQSYRFTGIRLNVGSTPPSNVQGNTIANMVWSSGYGTANLSAVWSGIYLEAGSANIGTIAGNTVGSGSGTGSVSVTSAGNGALSFGIGSLSSGNAVIANNTVGSITVKGTSTSISASFYGILVNDGVNTISNNAVGSISTANSINAATLSTSTVIQLVVGIYAAGISARVTDNTVANLNNNYVGTDSGPESQIGGIIAGSGVNTITGNTVRDLSTSAIWVYGIRNSSSAAAQTVSQNTVHSLASTSTSAAANVAGISVNGWTPPNIITRNFVHSLAISSTSVASTMTGMYFGHGISTVQNNMVRIGLKADGTSTADSAMVRGIYDNSSTYDNPSLESRNFYHNSVYIGGIQKSGSNSSAAFVSRDTYILRAIQNNIFVNARSNNGGTGLHMVVKYETIGSGYATDRLAEGNLFYVSGSGGVLGDKPFATTLASWQVETLQDFTSVVADPLFVNPTGTATTVDLHLQMSTPAAGGGLPIASVTDDFDGQPRSVLTPVDIGADAGNFIKIRYPLLSSGSTANRVLTNWVAITDGDGIASGASAPRLYFKKSTDADVFGVANDATGNGWKFVTATGSGPYSFTMNYAILKGGSVSFGNTIQYFVVAQDTANHLSSNPAGVTASALPPVRNVNGYATVNSYTIVGTISGPLTVGNSSFYRNLTGSSGLFAALNGAVLIGDVVVNIKNDLVEDVRAGSVKLNEFNSNEFPPTSTLKIQADSATMRTISGSATEGLITLKGADRVNIDGRFGGSGRYLTFRNTSTLSSASTLLFISDASKNSVRNCIMEGAGENSGLSVGVINFGTGTYTGNDNNLITGCQVRDLSTAAGVPAYLICAEGDSLVVTNSGNTIANNELFNFMRSGVYIAEKGNDSWTVSDNDIYEINTSPDGASDLFGIYMQASGTNIITGNFIHDLLATGSHNILGIESVGSWNPSATTIARNRITAFNASGVGDSIRGIKVYGSANSTDNVVNNQITISPNTSSNWSLFGIDGGGFGGSILNVFYNSIVLGGRESGTRSSWASVRQGDIRLTARNNLYLNFRTGGTGTHFAAASEESYVKYTSSHNVYAGTGVAGSMDFMSVSSAFNYPVPMSFATWQRTIGDTNSQAGVAGSGNFTEALFPNATIGDLHLAPGGNVLVNARGTPISSVTDDYDGALRSTTTPTIGVDEIPLPDIAVAQASALADGVGKVSFGTVTLGSSSAKAFTITNPGSAPLTSLTVTGGSDEFAVSALSGTSVPIGSSSVTFSVTFTPAASGARNATLQIASNVTGTKNPFDISLTGTGNAPPTFSGYTLKTKKNSPISVGLAKLLARAADSNGGTTAISTVSSASTQGGIVSLGANSVFYTPPQNFTGLDTFSVTIIDGQGGSVVGTVTCAVSEGNAPITNQPQITRQPGGSVALLFLGIPGQIYKVQRSTDLQIWTLLETATTALDGTLPSLDPSPPEGSAFYRIVVP